MSFQSRLIVLVSILASLLEIIDTSIVNVAIPNMMGNLGCTLDEVSVVITAYTVANAIVLPIAAWLSSRMGLREYYLGCIAVFTIASVACGLSPNLNTLIVCRIIQGLAGGALLPTSQALIFQQFPKEKSGVAGAIFGMSVMIGPTLGPVMGGYLTDHYGWSSIFNINLPIGLFTLFIGFLCIKSNKEKTFLAQSKLDIIGLILLVLGIGCLQYLLERGQSQDWFNSKIITIAVIVSTFSLILFVFWELKVKSPIINIFLFKQKIVVCGVLLMAALGFYLYGVVFILPVFLQTMFHYTATQSGLIFIPGSLLTVVCMGFVGRNLNKILDPRIFIFVGLVFIEISLYLMNQFSSMTSDNEVLLMLYMRGFALSFMFVPINSSILSQFTGYEMGQVAGLLNLFRQVGGSIGIAVIDTLFSRKINLNYYHLIEHVSLLNQNTQNTYYPLVDSMSKQMGRHLGLSEASKAALRSIHNRVYAQAFILTFTQIVVTVAIVFASSFIVLYFLRIKNKTVGVVETH